MEPRYLRSKLQQIRIHVLRDLRIYLIVFKRYDFILSVGKSKRRPRIQYETKIK